MNAGKQAYWSRFRTCWTKIFCKTIEKTGSAKENLLVKLSLLNAFALLYLAAYRRLLIKALDEYIKDL